MIPLTQLPHLMIIGRGRAGKDSTAEILSRHSRLLYCGSTSTVMLPLIAKEIGISEEAAWNTRHAYRQYWKDFCDKFRANDPSIIGRMLLDTGSNFVVGPRDVKEIKTIQDEGLVDMTIWIERNVPEDITVSFGPELADIVVTNNGNYAELEAKLINLAKAMNIFTS